MEYVVQVLTTSQEGITAHHRSEASWIAGEIALALNDTNKAELLARLAQRYALIAKEPELMNRAVLVLAEASRRRKQEAAQ